MTRRSFNKSAAGEDLYSTSGAQVTDSKEKADLLIDLFLGERNTRPNINKEIEIPKRRPGI